MSRLLAMIPVVVLAACSTWRPYTTVPTIEPVDPQMTGVLRVIGRYAIAHACPVAPTVALTNAHVVDLRPFDKEWPYYPMTASDGDGNEGVVVTDAADSFRDLAAVHPVGWQFKHWYPIAAQAPKVGDQARILAYDWRDRERAFEAKVIRTRVTRLLAGHVVLYNDGTPGSSGGCVLNDAGEVFAINAFGKELDDYQTAGLVISIWGDLLKRTVSADSVLFELFVPEKEK